MKALIQKLVETPGPSGHEQLVREVVRSEISELADELQTDALGNLIARKGSRGSRGMKVMLAAHMDEIGLMVTHVDERGFARFTNIGGVYARNCVGGRVRFVNGVCGVIGHDDKKYANDLPSLDEMFIDVGVDRKRDSPIRVGDVAAFERPFLDLGTRWVGKAMDDRIGVAVLIETLRRLKKSPHEVYFVFSVQEEVGLRGATTAAYALDPDVGIAVDVTRTGDTPRGQKMDIQLGQGPAIKVRDSGMLADPRVVSWMVNKAERAGLPHQMEVLTRGTTDARVMQITRAGVPSGCISIPCRYVHSPSEMVDSADVDRAVQLLLKLLSENIQLDA